MASVKKGTAVFVDASSVKNLRAALARFPSSFFIQASQAFLSELGELQGIMKEKTALPPGPIEKGSGVHKQTGRLTGSWGVAVTGSELKDLKGSAFSFAGIKAKRLELGDVATPGGTTNDVSNARAWIFIPTDLNRRTDGTAQQSVQQVLDAGGQYVNRHRKGASVAPAIIDGKPSPAWNLLVTGRLGGTALIDVGDPMFIMVKSARYVPPYFQFFATGQEFSKRLPPKLAEKAVAFFKDVTI